MAGLELPTIGSQLIPALLIAAFIYGFIFVIRWILEQAPWQWTNHIGPRLGPILWVSFAFVVACAFTFTFKLNVVGELFSLGHMDFPQAWMGYAATAAGISASSNLAHFLLRPLRKKYRCMKTGKMILLPEGQDLPANQEVVSPETKEGAEPVVPEAPVAQSAQHPPFPTAGNHANEETPARLFYEVRAVKPGYHVLVGGALYPLQGPTAE